MLLLLYIVAIFVSAFLLFLVQPMFARMALPLLGGSPAVWNTAMVFYQAALLLGYAYAHFSTKRLGVRRQAGLHLGLLLLPLPFLPIALPRGWMPPTDASPAPWLLLVMLVAVGAPFFVVSTTSPLLQRWFAATGHRSSADPYFLYAASNVGSLFALLGYPVLVEPYLNLEAQSRLWAGGYALLLLLMAGCAVALWRSKTATTPAPSVEERRPVSAKIGGARRLRWVLLSLVPSSLMLSVTTYLSTDIAAVPLLWVIPLALYLLTFILVFARKPPLPHALMVRALPILFVALVLVLAMRATEPLSVLVALNLLAFFAASMVCHGEMARDRPDAERLTEFYLWMSVGGVLGGIFNALIAPLIFNSVAEYPLTLVLACLLLPRLASGSVREEKRRRVLDVVLPLALTCGTAAMIAGVAALELPPGPAAYGLMFGPSVLIVFFFSQRPVRFALGIAAVLLAGGALSPGGQESATPAYARRSFFGIHRVGSDTTGRYRQLMHGHTVHGMQSLDPARRQEPLNYYTRSGPIGQVFGKRPLPPNASVGVVGLGAGSLAVYAKPGESWTFYEIDPVVARIAQTPEFFTLLRDCRASKSRVVLGDARLSLAQTDARYDLLILDAYSSDSIPMHLITREALRLYRERLAPGGVIAFHISNLHLNLEPVLAGLAADAGMACRVQHDTEVSEAEKAQGKTPSEWLVMARAEADFGPLLAASKQWAHAESRPGMAVWTDDYSSILSVFTGR